MKTLKILSLSMFSIILMISCGGDPDPVVVSSISASGTSFEDGSALNSDLNGTSSAEGVALDATITIVFDMALDATTVNSTNITLTDAGTSVPVTVTGSNMSATVKANADFKRGTIYTLTISGVQSVDEGLFTTVTRTFTTEGRASVVVPHANSQEAYWTFDGNTAEVNSAYTTANEIKVTFTEDRFGQGSSCISFDGDETLVEIGNGSSLLATDDFTLSFWMKSDGSDVNENDETRGQFVMGLGAWNGFQFEIFGNYGGCKLAASWEVAGGVGAAQDIFWSTNGDLGWMGWTYDHDISSTGGLAGLIKDKWTHVIVSYDSSTKVGTMYMNGILRKSQDYNLYGEGHPFFGAVGMKYVGNDAPGDRLALGFIQGTENRIISDDWANPIGFPDNNHFKGQLDDLRIFHASFTPADAKTLYDAEKN